MAKIRSFLAIDLPKEIIGKLGEIQNDLKSVGAQVKWVRLESIHLTLKFFGNIEEKNIDEISRVLAEVASKINVFGLEVKGTGVFPNIARPRVIWAGIKYTKGTLDLLHKEAESCLSKIGFEPEGRQFRAHLTLGRFKSLKDKRHLIQKIEEFENRELGTFKVKSLYLFKSELRPTGAVYTKLKTFDLAGS